MNDERRSGTMYGVKNDDRRTEAAYGNRKVHDVRGDTQIKMNMVDQRDRYELHWNGKFYFPFDAQTFLIRKRKSRGEKKFYFKNKASIAN